MARVWWWVSSGDAEWPSAGQARAKIETGLTYYAGRDDYERCVHGGRCLLVSSATAARRLRLLDWMLEASSSLRERAGFLHSVRHVFLPYTSSHTCHATVISARVVPPIAQSLGICLRFHPSPNPTNLL